jgi:hypothetical protein
MKTTPLNNYTIPSTLPAKTSRLYGHWFDSGLKPLRDAAREAARAAGYYEQHQTYN